MITAILTYMAGNILVGLGLVEYFEYKTAQRKRGEEFATDASERLEKIMRTINNLNEEVKKNETRS